MSRCHRQGLIYNASALHLGRDITPCGDAAMPKAAEILEIPATITERGQTTVPAAIRRMKWTPDIGPVVKV